MHGDRQFIGWARVSSPQQQSNYSLSVQRQAIEQYAEQLGGTIVRWFELVETAYDAHKRDGFAMMLKYAKDNAASLNGIIAYSVDRTTRNLFDAVTLMGDVKVPLLLASQNIRTDTPHGRMAFGILATIGQFENEQRIEKVRAGMQERVRQGEFLSRPPYGYLLDNKANAFVDPVRGKYIRYIFQMFERESLTVEALRQHLFEQGILYRDSAPKFPKTTLHRILQCRAYLGEVPYKGQWLPGKHEALVDAITFERVQQKLTGRQNRSHAAAYGGGLIRCNHCGGPMTPEPIRKANGRVYVYYRCSRLYVMPDHLRKHGDRVREQIIDDQLLNALRSLKISDEHVGRWFLRVLRESTKEQVELQRSQQADISQQLQQAERRLRKLHNKWLDSDDPNMLSDADFSEHNARLRAQIADLKERLHLLEENQSDVVEASVKAFELSQSMENKWVTADHAAKRRLAEILFLNLKLDGATLVPEWRKPFDVLAEGLSSASSIPNGI